MKKILIIPAVIGLLAVPSFALAQGSTDDNTAAHKSMDDNSMLDIRREDRRVDAMDHMTSQNRHDDDNSDEDNSGRHHDNSVMDNSGRHGDDSDEDNSGRHGDNSGRHGDDSDEDNSGRHGDDSDEDNSGRGSGSNRHED